MDSLTRYSKGYKIRYRIYYPDGSDRIAFAYRRAKRDAEDILGQASQVESITRQNALTLDTATPFQPWRLLTDEDLQRWFPRRSGPLRYDHRALLEAYRAECALHCTSLVTLHSLRHTFATWRLMMGDPLLLVKGWMGDSSAETLLRYAHVQVDPMADLLQLL